MFDSWSFVSKNLEDPYVNMLAASVHESATAELDYSSKSGPVVLRGIMKHKLMKRCWQDHRDFFYVDTGYFGNEPCASNPRANKLWHRIVHNDLQHHEIRPSPSDRWQKFQRALPQRRASGRWIVIAAPDEKPCKFYQTTPDLWINDVMTALKQHTDRPIMIRQRVANRQQRMVQQPLSAVLQDAYALVTFNSLAAIEAVMAGVPAITTSPCHAAAPVTARRIQDIESLFWPDQDLLHQWLCHLAYGQYHVSEMRSGMAMQQLLKQCQYNS